MGIREKLNNKPWIAAGVGLGALVLGAVFIATQLSPSGGTSDEAFFTTDDGQTWFSDAAENIAPFQHDGKEAVRAHVFECGGKEFVNHLERFSPQGRKLMEEMAAARKAGKPLPPRSGAATPEVKKPGAKEWVSASNYAKAGAILNAKCPDGNAEAIPVMP